MEEAALIASEYISTLDNLPNEVQHLLAEIRVKDDKIHTILADVQQRSQRYIKLAVRQPSPTTQKDAAAAAFDDAYAEMDRLSQDKIQLAQRILALLTRASGRLDVDIQRALAASGDNPPDTGTHASLSAHPSGSWPSARATTDRLKESLKQELASLPPSEPHSPSPSITQPPLKKRRINPVAAAESPTPTTPAPRSSRVTLQVARSTRRSTSVIENDNDNDQDAEGEADDEDPKDTGEPEDQTLYCYCRKLSYGEMVGCDNGECPYQWFHLSCTGIKGDLPDSWYCSDCAPKFQFGGPSEKSRKGRRPRDRS